MSKEISEFYIKNTGSYKFGTPDNSTIFLQGLGTSPGISVNANFVMGNYHINFGSSVGETGYGIGNSGGSIVVKNSGGDWNVITDIGKAQGGVSRVQFSDSNNNLEGSSGFLYYKGTSTISVNGNVFSNFGVSGLGGTSSGPSSNNSVFELVTPEEFVNGIYFPQVMTYYYDTTLTSDRAVYRVKVPDWYDSNGISVKFPELANPGFRNSFETTFYGTCTNPTSSGTCQVTPVITIMNNTNTIFDQRLFPSGSGTCLTFSLASDSVISLNYGYGSGVTIKSIVHSSGISMYPVGTVNYRTVEITGGTGGGGGGGGGGTPYVTAAEVPSGQPSIIELTYSENVQVAGTSPGFGDYQLTIDGVLTGINFTSGSATGNVVTLGIDDVMFSTDTITLDYDNTSSYVTSDPGGVAAESFNGLSVTNNL